MKALEFEDGQVARRQTVVCGCWKCVYPCVSAYSNVVWLCRSSSRRAMPATSSTSLKKEASHAPSACLSSHSRGVHSGCVAFQRVNLSLWQRWALSTGARRSEVPGALSEGQHAPHALCTAPHVTRPVADSTAQGQVHSGSDLRRIPRFPGSFPPPRCHTGRARTQVTATEFARNLTKWPGPVIIMIRVLLTQC
jgi:hypothetical protein